MYSLVQKFKKMHISEQKSDPNSLSPEKRKSIMNQARSFKKGKLLGSGTFGSVYKLVNSPIVVKQFKNHQGNGEDAYIYREAATLRILENCPFNGFPQFFGIGYHHTKPSKLGIYMEECDGTLDDHEFKSVGEVRNAMFAIIRSLIYMHNRGLIHRDIKGSNILRKNGDSMLIDFSATTFDILNLTETGNASTFSHCRSKTTEVYTVTHRPVELFLGSKYDFSADIWAAGVCFLNICSKKRFFLDASFDSSSDYGIMLKIFETLGTPTERSWPGVSNLENYSNNFPKWENKDVADQAILLNRFTPGVDDKNMREHGKDLLRKMLFCDPSKRITLKQIIRHPFFEGFTFPEEYIERPLERLRLMDTVRIDAKYMQQHADINARMRLILVEWLLEVVQTFRLKASTFFTGILLLDKYLQRPFKPVSRKMLQIIGCACMHLSSLVNEIYIAELSDWVFISDNSFTQMGLKCLAEDIWEHLNHHLFFVTEWTYAEHFLQPYSDHKHYRKMLDFAYFIAAKLSQHLESREYSLQKIGECAASCALANYDVKDNLRIVRGLIKIVSAPDKRNKLLRYPVFRDVRSMISQLIGQEKKGEKSREKTKE